MSLVLDVRNRVIERLAVGANRVQNRVAAGNAVVVRVRRVVLPVAVEADGQLAFGIVLAEDHFSNSRAAFLARIPGVQQRGNLVEPAAHVHGAAAGERDDGVRILRRDRFNQRVLTPGQREGAVVAFALGRRIEADGNHHRIGELRKLLCFGRNKVGLIDNAQSEVSIRRHRADSRPGC